MHLASFQPNTDAFNNCTTGSQSAFYNKSSSTTGYISSVISACLQCILDPDGCKKTAFQLQYRLAEIHSHQCWGYIQHL